MCAVKVALNFLLIRKKCDSHFFGPALIQLGGLLRTYVLDSACLLLPECLRETKEKHDLKGHRARTQTAALRVGGS